ncbi:hypothetical protein [Paenibacillus sp. PDC88]|nr:hypothetical protein [Paenibacillus sp. PDC88]SDX70957.1 hypothetical protein SAMN05518848_11259 [Paenibacillus sp. PDC88]SFS88397.1 hypothetical protein SAMN04488601_10655 [Paenibacillus sp. 453mf]
MREPNPENLQKAIQMEETTLSNLTTASAQELLRMKLMQEVIRSVYPFSINENTATYKEVLRGLSVFGDRRVDIILKYCTSEQIVKLAAITAIEITKMILDLPREKIYQAKWGENQNKVLEAVQQYFPWFEEVEEKLQLEVLATELSGKVKNSLERVLRIGAASIMNEKVAFNLRSQVDKRFEDLRAEIEASICEEEVKAHLIGKELPETKALALEHISKKFAEEPIRLLYYRSGTRAAVKLAWNKDVYSIHKGRGKEVRLNRGEDRNPYGLIVSLNYIEEFLYFNEVRDDDVWVEEDSLESIYQFNSNISVNLTPAFVKEWYNYDAPVLQRISPNRGKRGETAFGMKLFHFTTNLVESSLSTDYISEDITHAEAFSLMKGYEHTRISKEIRNTLKAREIEEAGKTEEIKHWVEAYDARVQSVIDENSKSILNALSAAFHERVEWTPGTDGEMTLLLDDNFGLDCGYLNIQVNDSEYTEKRSILRNTSSNVGPWMDVRMPVVSQSTTIMMKQFEIAKEIVKSKLGIELFGHTVLD